MFTTPLKHWIIFIILIWWVLIPLAAPQPVYAATDTLTIDGQSVSPYPPTPIGSYVGGAADYTNLNSSDGDTSYYAPGTGMAALWTATNATFSDDATINSVTVSVSAKWGSAAYRYFAIGYYGSTFYQGDMEEVTGSYVTYTWVMNTNPGTGLAWTKTQVNDAKFGVNSSVGIRFSYITIAVNYTEPTLPTVSSSAATSITTTTATLNGSIDATGGDTPDYYGFVWDSSDKGDPGNADPSTPPGTWSNGWKSGSGSYGVDDYDHGITGLSENVTYYFRFAAHNAAGWEYSSALSFKTDYDPAVTTRPATSVGTTSARLNAKVDDDGGEAVSAAFAWAETDDCPCANWAALVGAASGHSENVTGTWATGTYPYLSVDNLTASTGYTFMVRAVNQAGTVYGSQLTFTTTSGIDPPSSLTAIPDDETASLLWVKGAPGTLLRYKTGSYPTGISEGALAYLGAGNSIQVSGLTAGRTYYVSGWGVDSGVYSDNYTTVMFTTLAYGASAGDDLEAPAANSNWDLTPDASIAQSWPLVGGLVSAIATEYGQPENWLWFFIFMIAAAVVGIVVYNKGNNNIVLACACSAAVMLIGSAAFQLIMLALGVIFIIIAGGFMTFGQRR